DEDELRYYTLPVIKETMRLFPPILYLFRMIEKETDLGYGYSMVISYATHRRRIHYRVVDLVGDDSTVDAIKLSQTLGKLKIKQRIVLKHVQEQININIERCAEYDLEEIVLHVCDKSSRMCVLELEMLKHKNNICELYLAGLKLVHFTSYLEKLGRLIESYYQDYSITILRKNF
ncbi:hypothetical protein L9F63_009711, partial [Diploptera punctata]